jgi:class I fructose-bisphosphate aldolase
MVDDRPRLTQMAHMDEQVSHRLWRMMYERPPQNGTMLILPFDQLVEHGPGYEFVWERSAKCDAVVELANVGPFAAVVLSLGQAQKYHLDIEIPLIVKLDGHFYTGEANAGNYPMQTNFGAVAEAVACDADAIGLTFYLGSERTGEDVERIGRIREQAHAAGLPLILWCYPRGPVVNMCQNDSLLWCHYAVSAGESLGADVVKTKYPSVVEPARRDGYENFILNEYALRIPLAGRYLDYEPSREAIDEYRRSLGEGENADYDSLLTRDEHVERVQLVVGAGTRTFVIFSGGPKVAGRAEDALRETTRTIMDAGGEGRIIGRNLWGVPIDEGVALAQTVVDVMGDTQYSR